MYRRWIRDLSVELYRMRRNIICRVRTDTRIVFMGILTLISGLVLFGIIVNGIAYIFRSSVPWVYGTRVGEIYWQSIGFGIKASFIFLIFSGSLIIFFLLKFQGRR